PLIRSPGKIRELVPVEAIAWFVVSRISIWAPPAPYGPPVGLLLVKFELYGGVPIKVSCEIGSSAIRETPFRMSWNHAVETVNQANLCATKLVQGKSVYK